MRKGDVGRSISSADGVTARNGLGGTKLGVSGVVNPGVRLRLRVRGVTTSKLVGGRWRRDGKVADALDRLRLRLEAAALIVLANAAALLRRRDDVSRESISAVRSLLSALEVRRLDTTVALPLRYHRDPLEIRLASPHSLMAELTMAKASSVRPAAIQVCTANLQESLNAPSLGSFSKVPPRMPRAMCSTTGLMCSLVGDPDEPLELPKLLDAFTFPEEPLDPELMPLLPIDPVAFPTP